MTPQHTRNESQLRCKMNSRRVSLFGPLLLWQQQLGIDAQEFLVQAASASAIPLGAH